MKCTECGRDFIQRTCDVTCSTDCRKKKSTKKGLADNELNAEILERFGNGEKQADIAKALGLTWGAVRSRVYLARRTGLLNPRRVPQVLNPDTAWERLRAELAEAHREEFLYFAWKRKAA